jgi:hypothetical protein
MHEEELTDDDWLPLEDPLHKGTWSNALSSKEVSKQAYMWWITEKLYSEESVF